MERVSPPMFTYDVGDEITTFRLATQWEIWRARFHLRRWHVSSQVPQRWRCLGAGRMSLGAGAVNHAYEWEKIADAITDGAPPA